MLALRTVRATRALRAPLVDASSSGRTSRSFSTQRLTIRSPWQLPIDESFVISRRSRAFGLSSIASAPARERSGCSATSAVCTQRANGDAHSAPADSSSATSEPSSEPSAAFVESSSAASSSSPVGAAACCRRIARRRLVCSARACR